MNYEENNPINQFINSSFPDEEKRMICLNALWESVIIANSFGSNKWGVYFQNDEYKLRLLVGSLIVLTVQDGRIWTALDKEELQADENSYLILNSSDYWTWDTDDYPEYKAVPSRNGYYTPCLESQDMWSLIKRLLSHTINKSAQKYLQLKANSQSKHDSDILDFLRKILNKYVPEPDYQSIHKKMDVQNSNLLEEVDEAEAEVFFEGAVQKITINIYERDRKARQESINHYGLSCYICKFNFEERYGDAGKDFIHVHHETPLATIGKAYKVNPIKDLKPLCANCHAIIHSRKLAYTVEEVRKMIR